MKLKFILFFVVLSINSLFAGKLITDDGFHGSSIESTCKNSDCTDLTIGMNMLAYGSRTMSGEVLSAKYKEVNVNIINDRKIQSQINKDICNGNIKTTVSDAGYGIVESVGTPFLFMFAAGSSSRSNQLLAMTCGFIAGTVAIIPVAVYRTGEGLYNTVDALYQNKEISAALNTLFFTDETLEVSSDSLRLISRFLEDNFSN